MELTNKKISVIGLGKTGLSVANLLASFGARVFVSEKRDKKEASGEISRLDPKIEYETGGHSERLLESELVIRSPGVSSGLPVFGKLAGKKIPVWSELELSFGLIEPKAIIAITGTNGKTTTTTLASNIFLKAGCDVVTAGNIGNPLSSFVDRIKKNTVVVLEVSSYQLEDIHRFKPDISCILNITPDHLEHHGGMQGYIDAKKKIFENQSPAGRCVLNGDDELCRALNASCPAEVIYFSTEREIKGRGVYYRKGSFELDLPDLKGSIAPELKIPGKHNIENVLAATAITALYGISLEVIEKAINEFKGVEHRIEPVREINGVKYINDSKSTNVDSTLVALRSFKGGLLLIMGGRDKGAPYTPLYGLVKDRVKTLYLIGEASGKIRKDLAGAARIIDCGDLETAVKEARKTALPGDTVLLSPGCSSFDQFRDFEHRGEVFKKLVSALE